MLDRMKYAEIVGTISEEEFKERVGKRADKLLDARRTIIERGQYTSNLLILIGVLFPLGLLVWLALYRYWSMFGVVLTAIIAAIFLPELLGIPNPWAYFMPSAVGAGLGGILPMLYIVKVSKTEPSKTHGDYSKEVRIVAFILLVAAGIYALYDISNEGYSGGMPTCQSEVALNDVQDVFDDSPMSNLIKIKIYSFQDIEETRYDEERGVRSCSATAIANIGEQPIIYSFKSQENGTYLVKASLTEL